MAGLRGPARVVVVCLSDEDDQAAELVEAAAPIPVIFYDGKPKPCTPIVQVYAQALEEIDADFFVFAHQDVRGNIPAWVQNGLDAMGQHDFLGVIGWDKHGNQFWGNTTETTVIDKCDECCFAFYKDSGLSFDPKLHWTNYSHDLCYRTTCAGFRALCVPNNIGHAQHRHGPWFVSQGFYYKDQAYVRAKWADRDALVYLDCASKLSKMG